jgi:hypothetical protein
MKCLKMIIILTMMPLLLFLSGCGDSDSSHVGSWKDTTLFADSARFPQVGADGSGNLIAVWAQADGIYTNRYEAVSGWGIPQKIGDTSQAGWSNLHLAVSRSGHAIAAWVNYEYHVQTIKYTPGVGWGTVENLDYLGVPMDVVVDDTGNAYLVGEFLEVRVNPPHKITYGLNIARSDQASGWIYERIEYIDSSTGHGFPKVSVDGSGNGFVLWVEGYFDFKVYVIMLSPAGLGAPQQIASSAGPFGSWTNLAMDDNGNAMALWGQFDPSSITHSYACRYTPANGWGAAKRVDDSSTYCIDQFLAVDPDGNFHAIWTQITGSSASDVYSSRFTPSTGWQTPSFVGSGGGTIARFPRIAADASGNVFAAWLQYDPNAPTGRFGGDGKIFANHCRAGSNWEIQQLLTTALGDGDNPSLAVYQRGRAMVMWSQSTGYVSGSSEIKYGIFSSRFE